MLSSGPRAGVFFFWVVFTNTSEVCGLGWAIVVVVVLRT